MHVFFERIFHKMLTHSANKLRFSIFPNRQNAIHKIFRHFCDANKQSKKPAVILGIETSCDDTACAIVNQDGQILGENKYSQLQFHLRCGGINPVFANELHREHIEGVVARALNDAKLSVSDVDAVAVTNRPGIERSLIVGTRYARHLARKYSKPLIPIHHMEAHALTARMENPTLSYPFLCLLASGGHCQLALVKSVTEFILLGESLDKAPGACLDRVAREMGLHLLPEYQNVCGGKAIELAAYKANNSTRFAFKVPLDEHRNCQFSFDGIHSFATLTIEEIRNRMKLNRDEMIPYYEDFCAAFLKVITKHLLQRTQRAIQYCDRVAAFGYGENKRPRAFVFSGGVACNDFIYTAMRQMVGQFGFQSYRCSKRLCSDNGVMIAWNGIERWQSQADEFKQLNIDSVRPDCFAKLGENHTELVAKKHLKCSFVKVPCMETNRIESNC